MSVFRTAGIAASLAACGLLVAAAAPAAELVVADRAQLVQALGAAAPGDEIVVAPGVYTGGLFAAGLTGVTIRGSDPANPPVIRGGTNGMQLSDPVDVTLEYLVIEDAIANGLNIDDGGSFATPARNVTLRELTLRNIGIGVPVPFAGESCYGLLARIGGADAVGAVQRFDVARGLFVSCGYAPGATAPSGDDFAIHPGQGYIVAMRRDAPGLQLNDPQRCGP